VLTAIAGTTSSDVWAVGVAVTGDETASTLAQHWNGRTWTHVVTPNGGPTWNAFSGVAVLSSRDVWAVGFYRDLINPLIYDTLTAHWDGVAWVKVDSPNVPDMGGNQLVDVRAIASDDVWAVGEYWRVSDAKMHALFMHWDGAAWSLVPSYAPPSGSYLYGMDAVGSDLWAVGWTGNQDATLAERWNGSRWIPQPTPSPGSSYNVLNGVGMRDQTDGWAVGSYGFVNTLVVHWNGIDWEQVPSPSPGTGVSGNNLLSVASVASGDAWSVGQYYDSDNVRHPLIEHWDGEEWLAVDGPQVTPGNSELITVTAVSSQDLWAVGDADDANGDPASLIERLCPIQVLNSGFEPQAGRIDQGATAVWSFPPSDTESHRVMDASGMGLFDSGDRAPGTSYTFAFDAAGSYPVLDVATSAHYRLSVPTQAAPPSGHLDTPFQITWSAGVPLPGYVFDVQIKRPGDASFQDWLSDQQEREVPFTADVGTGTYSFRARLRNTATGDASGYSPPASITVTGSGHEKP
jgi:plastocyanin